MRLTSQSQENSVASQSSSSGWLGASPSVPKFSLVLLRPVPKNSCQYRLICTRAVKGLSVRTSHFAKSRRFFIVAAPKTAGTAGATTSRGCRYSPRSRTRVCRGCASDITITFGKAARSDVSSLPMAATWLRRLLKSFACSIGKTAACTTRTSASETSTLAAAFWRMAFCSCVKPGFRSSNANPPMPEPLTT